MSERLDSAEADGPKRMRLRYAGRCARCGTVLQSRDWADYHRESKTVTCVECPQATAASDSDHVSPDQRGPVEGSASAPSVHGYSPEKVDQPDKSTSAEPGAEQSRHDGVEESPTTRQQLADEPSVTSEPDGFSDGLAGRSARREYERRHAAREDRVRQRHPKIGGLLLRLFDDPQHTKAWQTGAAGEVAVGSMLDRLACSELRPMHDRGIPRSRANIDHIVICPTGVYVIDAKRYRGRPALRVEGGLLRPRVELLTVAGRVARAVGSAFPRA